MSLPDSFPPEITVQGVTVLLKADGREPLEIGGIVVDRTECAKTQIGMRLIELGEAWIEYAQRSEERAGGERE